jgi:hypothetical protein
MTLPEARDKAREKGLTTYFGYMHGQQVITYELGFLEPADKCNVGLLCAMPDGYFRWVAMGRGNSWEQAFTDVDSRIN